MVVVGGWLAIVALGWFAPDAAEPTGTLTQLAVDGRLTERAVRSAIVPALPDMVQQCQLGHGDAVTATISLQVDRRGRASRIRVKGPAATAAGCVRKLLRGVQFPGAGGATRVRGEILFATGILGHGAGQDEGRSPARVVPGGHISIGKVDADGELDIDIIRRIVRSRFPRIRTCYDVESTTASQRSQVAIKFVIESDGNATRVKVTGTRDGALARCLQTVFDGLVFPRPDSGSVAVTYPLNYRPR